MSVSLRAFYWLLKTSGIKRKYDRPTAELNEWTIRKNRRRTFSIAPPRGWQAEMLRVEGREVLLLKDSARGGGRALLYLYGGGFTSEISNLEKRASVKFGRLSGRDVWIPRYPSCLEVSVRETYRMALAVYRRMLADYRPEQIAVVGASAGASIGLGMFEYNNTLETPLPPPGRMILLSPACLPATEQEEERIRALADADRMIPASFVQTIGETMRHGEELPAYMTELTTGDFSHMPPTHLYYGSDEVLRAAAEPLTEAYRRYGSACELHIGQGLFHCYPIVDFLPETKAAFREIVGYLSEPCAPVPGGGPQ